VAMHRAGASAPENAALLNQAQAQSKALATNAQSATPLVAALLKRIELGRDGLRLSLDLEPGFPQQ